MGRRDLTLDDSNLSEEVWEATCNGTRKQTPPSTPQIRTETQKHVTDTGPAGSNDTNNNSSFDKLLCRGDEMKTNGKKSARFDRCSHTPLVANQISNTGM